MTKGTFDAYGWGIVENKQRFISQVMTSKAVARNCEDIDEAVLSFAEIKAVATGNPMIREKMEVDNEVQRLKLLKSSYDSQRYSLQDNFMIRFPKLIASAKERLDCIREDVSKRNEMLVKEPEFGVKIGNTVFSERVDAGEVFLNAVHSSKKGVTSEIGKYKGFVVAVEKNWMGCDYLILRGRSEYKAEISMSAVGNMVKLENLFSGMESQEEFMKKRLEQYERDMEQSRAEYEKPFLHELELRQKLQRQGELNSMLDLENERIVDVKSEEMEIGKEEMAMCR